MKKVTVYSLVLLSFLFSACGSNTTREGNNASENDELQTPKSAKRSAAVAPHRIGHIPAPISGAQLFTTKRANKYIANYNASSEKLQQTSFVFRTQELLDYLNASGNSIVNFIIGENNTEDTLFLFAAPVDQQGNHQYYQRNDTCFVLGETYVVDIPTTLEQETSAIDTYFIEAVSTSRAQSMIDAYASIPSFKNKNNGWLYNANDLAGYLQAGIDAGGMEYTQFIMAMKKTEIDLIIVGSNNGTNHMYFNFSGNTNVMDNGQPCPYCDIVSGGTSFDAPSCTY
jgi:hypothetical protein